MTFTKQLLITLVFILLFSTISKAQEITLFPGGWGIEYYENDQKISKTKVKKLLKKNKVATMYWKKYQNQEIAAYALLGAEMGFIVWGFSSLLNNKKIIMPFLGVLASAGGSIGFTISSNINRRKAILRYNKDIKTKSTSLNLQSTKNGYGLVLNF